MTRDEVRHWIDGYEQAWRESDLDAVGNLFSIDATYLRSPYEEPIVGLDAIKELWYEDDPEVFTMAAEPVAVEGDTAVIRVEVRYGEPLRQEYRDLWVVRFGTDGRATHFEEWPYWPGRGYLAPSD